MDEQNQILIAYYVISIKGILDSIQPEKKTNLILREFKT